MAERGILFSAPMVRALLDGSKTQTRRAIKPHPSDDAFVLLDHGDGWWPYRSKDGESANVDNMEYPFNCPYGQPGDRLWVRETFCDLGEGSFGLHEIEYRADGECDPNVVQRWTPSIHMPRWASRILLEITSARVERLQDISDMDAIAEGIGLNPSAAGAPMTMPAGETMPRAMYRELWESINGAGSWDANPWVWVVEFKRIEA